MERRGGAYRPGWDEAWDKAFSARVEMQARQEAEARLSSQGPVVALDRVNLTIPDGQTFAVIGPSGCGKSTLLRVVAGLDQEYTGDVYYDDENMRDVPPKDRYIGMVFQNYALYPHFKGRGNLKFFFQVHKAPDAEAEERIRVTAEIMGFGFNQLLERKPGTLSGGEQQRLAIGRAIVRNPRLFLFDEPLSNLDAKLRAQTRVEIKRLLRRFAITSIYVTHDQEEAMALADQIAVMREGRIEQVGACEQLLQNPANAFVAGFLGKHPMNLLTGVVAEDGTLRVEGLALPLPMGVRTQCGPGEEITLGMRPEAGHSILTAEAGPGDVCLRGEVEMIEPDFVRRINHVRVCLGSQVFTVTLPMEEGWRPGENIQVVFPGGQLYFFDARSGKRISP